MCVVHNGGMRQQTQKGMIKHWGNDLDKEMFERELFEIRNGNNVTIPPYNETSY